MTSGPDFKPKNSFYWLHDVDAKLQLRRKGENSTVKNSESTFNVEPAIAASDQAVRAVHSCNKW